eukprot:2257153-Pyramimonas_sp.AAC.1
MRVHVAGWKGLIFLRSSHVMSEPVIVNSLLPFSADHWPLCPVLQLAGKALPPAHNFAHKEALENVCRLPFEQIPTLAPPPVPPGGRLLDHSSKLRAALLQLEGPTNATLCRPDDKDPTMVSNAIQYKDITVVND